MCILNNNTSDFVDKLNIFIYSTGSISGSTKLKTWYCAVLIIEVMTSCSYS